MSTPLQRQYMRMRREGYSDRDIREACRAEKLAAREEKLGAFIEMTMERISALETTAGAWAPELHALVIGGEEGRALLPVEERASQLGEQIVTLKTTLAKVQEELRVGSQKKREIQEELHRLQKGRDLEKVVTKIPKEWWLYR